MSIVRNENDKLPEDLVAEREAGYTAMMNVGYKIGMPISLGIVMALALVMTGTGLLMATFLGVLTGLGVLAFVKLFLIH